MKVLFVGLGSIGQRHLRNFKKLVGAQAEILVYRTTEHNLLIENGLAFKCDSLQKHYGYHQVATLDEGLAQNPDIVFVTNPSSKHIDVALEAAKSKCNIFIEKPLSNNLKGVKLLERLVAKNNLVVKVGYQTKFHPCYSIVVDILLQENYGKLISASFQWGTYLPDHHPYEDYRDGYAANDELGGGVTLGLIHEIDLIYSFLGIPKIIHAIGGNLSSLEMSAEDTVSVLMGFEIDNRVIPVSLFLSYAQKCETRQFTMQFDKALLICNFITESVMIYGSKGEVLFQACFSTVNKNEIFKAELQDFLDEMKNRGDQESALRKGIDSLKIALQIKDKINETAA